MLRHLLAALSRLWSRAEGSSGPAPLHASGGTAVSSAVGSDAGAP